MFHFKIKQNGYFLNLNQNYFLPGEHIFEETCSILKILNLKIFLLGIFN